jgi:hypothetical protein
MMYDGEEILSHLYNVNNYVLIYLTVSTFRCLMFLSVLSFLSTIM